MFGLGLKSRARGVLGRLAALAFPRLAKEVRQGNNRGQHRRIKWLISGSELARLNAAGDHSAVQKALTSRWTSDNMPASYYDRFSDRFTAMFEGPHAPVVAWLKDYAGETDITHVIEIGCGDGRALAAMSEAVGAIPRWTGVDINAEIIARNKDSFADCATLAFVAADAVEWLGEHAEAGSLLMTYGGVMEYIAPETLLTWFALIRQNDGRGVLLVEPIDPDHNLQTNPDSHVWGAEQSYSHNHRVLLEKAGYQVRNAAEVEAMGYRWVMMLATPGQV